MAAAQDFLADRNRGHGVRAFYEPGSYAAARAVRERISDTDLILAEGLEAPCHPLRRLGLRALADKTRGEPSFRTRSTRDTGARLG